ncbi:MAG TPA: hypothetical protein VEH57_07840 [Thermoplasmata archaeon]|nr:hypothetical protein [Thermoplasmata archaeon]
MERALEKSLGCALTAIGLAILLFGFYQAYHYTQSPPSGTYNVFQLGGSGGGGGNGSINGSFNGRFLVTFMFLGIEYLVGASILKAGWNLITPKAETIQVRVKPKSLQVEPAGYSVPPGAPVPPGAATTGPTAVPPSGGTGVGPPPPTP